MILRIIIWTIIIGFLYRVVVRFLFPVFQITKMASEKMREMQQQMDQMNKRQNTPPPTPKKEPRHIDGDYIDYEEVK